MEPVPINWFKSGTGSINRFQKKNGLPALLQTVLGLFSWTSFGHILSSEAFLPKISLFTKIEVDRDQ
jgi:hypothetical protein